MPQQTLPAPAPTVSRRWARLRVVPLAVVLGLHALGLGTLANLGVWRDRRPPPPEQAPLQVWLLRPPGSAAARPARPENAPSRTSAAPASSTSPRAPRSAPAEPQAITLPASEQPGQGAAAAPANAGAGAVAAVGPAASAALPPLNLTLPRGASAPWRVGRNPALDDLSARSARATFESRFARENGGSGEWVEERLGTDRIQFRRGGICVEMERSRTGQLDGFNQSAMPKPWGAKQPREC